MQLEESKGEEDKEGESQAHKDKMAELEAGGMPRMGPPTAKEEEQKEHDTQVNPEDLKTEEQKAVEAEAVKEKERAEEAAKKA